MNSEVLHFQFWALPFGLSFSPRFFTKVLAEALAPLRIRAITVIPYLDDLLFVAHSVQLAKDLREAQDFLQSLGWLINWDKSQLTPTQEIQYLGYRISSVEMKIFLPMEKIEKIGQAVAQLQTNQEAQIREVMRVLGLMMFCFPAVPWARHHQRPLQGLMLHCLDGSKQSLDQPMPLSSKVKRALWWWWAHYNLDRGLLWADRCQCFWLGCPPGGSRSGNLVSSGG